MKQTNIYVEKKKKKTKLFFLGGGSVSVAVVGTQISQRSQIDVLGKVEINFLANEESVA